MDPSTSATALETQRVMTPLHFMARAVALIPPPFHPLLRYFGVFGPHSSWRKSVVPQVAPAATHQHDHAKSAAAKTRLQWGSAGRQKGVERYHFGRMI